MYTNQNRHLHKHPGQNDFFTSCVLHSFNNLRARPEEFALMYEICADEVDFGSGIVMNRHGLESKDIVAIYNDLYRLNHKDKLEAVTLKEAGLLDFENEFGDNPEYMKAELLWWKQKNGIDSIEAIVRYHLQRTRALRRPKTHGFLSECAAVNDLNLHSTDYKAYRPLYRFIPPKEAGLRHPSRDACTLGDYIISHRRMVRCRRGKFSSPRSLRWNGN